MQKTDKIKIVDLGKLDAPILLWGGAYSNIQATRALLEFADRQGIPVSNRILTGDALGYCANPVETWELSRLSGGHMIAGNVEIQLAKGAQDCGCGFEAGSACDFLSKGWFSYLHRRMTSVHRADMARLPDILLFSLAGKVAAVIHGGITDVSRFLFSTSAEADFRTEITALETLCGPIDVVVAGHSGIAFRRQIDGCLWINAGAIGMPPNDGKPGGEFAVLTASEVFFHRLHYDHAATAAAMRAAGLRQGYETTIETGFWTSQEVLPEALKK